VNVQANSPLNAQQECTSRNATRATLADGERKLWLQGGRRLLRYDEHTDSGMSKELLKATRPHKWYA
jgi:hypothetical protein